MFVVRDFTANLKLDLKKSLSISKSEMKARIIALNLNFEKFSELLAVRKIATVPSICYLSTGR